jgi:hypothetical protein
MAVNLGYLQFDQAELWVNNIRQLLIINSLAILSLNIQNSAMQNVG